MSALPKQSLGIARRTAWSWGVRPAADPAVLLNWDFRLGRPAGSTEQGTPAYDATNGMDCAAGFVTFQSVDDAAFWEQGTLWLEVQRSVIDWDNDTFADGYWVDSAGNTLATGNQYITRIINSGATREIFAYRNTVSAGRLTCICEGATNDDTQPIFPAEYYGLSRYMDVPEVDADWAVFAITWRNGLIHFMLDGQVICSFHRSTAAGDFATIHIGGFGANYFTGYLRRAQITNEFVAPHMTGPRQCLLGDSFVLRATSRVAAATEDLAGYRAVQGSLSYSWGEPGVAGQDRFHERGNVPWMFSGHFTVLQRLATLKYGIWPKVWSAGRNGSQWRSDLGSQINSAQVAYVKEVDPEILWCFGSVNDIDQTDQTHTIVADIMALLDDIAGACYSLRRIIYVETFATPETINENQRAGYSAAWDALRQALRELEGESTTNARGETIAIEYIRTWEQWAPAGIQPGEYAIGSVPESDDPVGVSTNGDIHPTARGTIRMAEILWPTFRSLIVGPVDKA